ncbi:MAG: DUF2442 domain-containing protein [Terricaulis sp.]|nr:DUF2442 domain-containing protein [Terricaulis sp.]
MPKQHKIASLPKIIRVKPLGGYRLEIGFSDGAAGAFDFGWVFERVGPMNAPLQDEAFFARVFLENGALAWPNGFDLSAWNVRARMEAAGVLATARGVAAE